MQKVGLQKVAKLDLSAKNFKIVHHTVADINYLFIINFRCSIFVLFSANQFSVFLLHLFPKYFRYSVDVFSYTFSTCR